MLTTLNGVMEYVHPPLSRLRDKGGSNDDRGTEHDSRLTYRALIANRNESECAGWPRAKESIVMPQPSATQVEEESTSEVVDELQQN